MRELRFRAWDDDQKKMLPEVDLSGPIQTFMWLGKKDLTIMQFTGLFDKNGKPIFEGDILKGNYDNLVIEFVKGGFMAYGKSSHGTNSYYGSHEFEYMEIIGNRYEHPELLKEKQ